MDVFDTESAQAALQAVLQAFVDARRRPAIFFMIEDDIGWRHAYMLRKEVGTKTFSELDFVIHSGGGDIHAAYQIVNYLRMHLDESTGKLIACVPKVAKSAATLLCLGADLIVLDEIAQLGPLDTQIYEVKAGGKGSFVSALNLLKTMEEVRTFSQETLISCMKEIWFQTGRGDILNLDECLTHANQFVRATMAPLIAHIESGQIGDYIRSLQLGKEYGKRLLSKSKLCETEGCESQERVEKILDNILEKLIYSYPHHDFVINYHELMGLGIAAELFTQTEHDAVEDLIDLIGFLEPIDVIKYVEFSPNSKE